MLTSIYVKRAKVTERSRDVSLEQQEEWHDLNLSASINETWDIMLDKLSRNLDKQCSYKKIKLKKKALSGLRIKEFVVYTIKTAIEEKQKI